MYSKDTRINESQTLNLHLRKIDLEIDGISLFHFLISAYVTPGERI